MSLLSCKNISVFYDNYKAIENISFDITKGDYICVVGENGAGKSTLIKAIGGLLKVKSGKIEFGNNTSSKQIGYLPQQNIIKRDFPACVFEVVLSGCLNQKGLISFYTKKDREKAEKNIARLGIKHLSKKPFSELSGGQQQRVLLARALCATKDLLILDEPVSGLDPVVTAELYTIISDLNKNSGVTIIMVSHDVEIAIKYADKILHICKEVKFFGKTKDYIDSKVGRLFIGGDN